MGFFSWDCKGCTHSVREGHRDDWMTADDAENVAECEDCVGKRVVMIGFGCA